MYPVCFGFHFSLFISPFLSSRTFLLLVAIWHPPLIFSSQNSITSCSMNTRREWVYLTAFPYLVIACISLANLVCSDWLECALSSPCFQLIGWCLAPLHLASNWLAGGQPLLTLLPAEPLFLLVASLFPHCLEKHLSFVARGELSPRRCQLPIGTLVADMRSCSLHQHRWSSFWLTGHSSPHWACTLSVRHSRLAHRLPSSVDEKKQRFYRASLWIRTRMQARQWQDTQHTYSHTC